MAFFKKIEEEISSYLTREIEISDGIKFSQNKLVRRISLYQAQVYPRGKTDSQGNYKYWYDIITSCVNAEVKNIDFDSKDVNIYTDTPLVDRLATLLSNLFLRQWLKDNKQGKEINNNIETFSSWGNVVWKKVKGGFEEIDFKNFYVLNQSAKTLDDSDVIERHILTSTDLRAKKDVWKNIDKVIKDCGNKFFSATEKSQEIETTNKLYEIYERNGEVSEKDFFEAQGRTGGDEEKFVLAKIIFAGLKKGDKNAKYVLFADEIKEKPYREAHRSKYEERWFRKGLYEILFDCQTRANEIGNQLARGLEWSSKAIFFSPDLLITQNALTGLRTGDIIKTTGLTQVDIRMRGIDQLIADWNRNIALAKELSNSYEVVTGESLPSGTSFKLGSMQNQNANKLFDFLREKLALGLEAVFNDWILPEMIKELKSKKILELTGDAKLLEEYNQMLVNAWYLNNLLSFPPHSIEQAQEIKMMKLEELKKNKKQTLKIEDDFWQDFKPRAKVVISGEGVNLASELESLASFIPLEADPIRRNFLLDQAYAKKGIMVPPAQPPQPVMSQQPMQPANQPNQPNQPI